MTSNAWCSPTTSCQGAVLHVDQTWMPSGFEISSALPASSMTFQYRQSVIISSIIIGNYRPWSMIMTMQKPTVQKPVDGKRLSYVFYGFFRVETFSFVLLFVCNKEVSTAENRGYHVCPNRIGNSNAEKHVQNSSINQLSQCWCRGTSVDSLFLVGATLEIAL